MKKLFRYSLLLVMVTFVFITGVKLTSVTASAANEDALFEKYVSSNFSMLNRSKVTDKNSTGVICYLIKDLDSDKTKEMILFERNSTGIVMYLYEAESGKVVCKGTSDKKISGFGSGNFATVTCVYLDGNTIRFDYDCTNSGGSSSSTVYLAYTVKNNKLSKVSHFESFDFPRYNTRELKNVVSGKTYTNVADYKNAVKAAGFDVDGHMHLGTEFDAEKDNPQTAKCFRGKHIFCYLNSQYMVTNGAYGFIVDNTSAHEDITLGKPANLKATPSTTSVKLTWSKVMGATGYYIYRKTSSGWENIDTTKGISSTIKGLKAATSYTFAVKAVKNVDGKIVGADTYSTVKFKTKAAAPKLSVTQSTSVIKLSWSKISGADGYRIYRKSGDSWVKIADTTSTSYRVTKLTAGKQYTFRVATYTKSGSKITIGAYSSSFTTATEPAVPTLKVTSKSAGKATLTWSDVSGETGYKITYSTKKDSGYKKYGLVKANQTTATVSGLTQGKTYYFRVQGYIKPSGGTVYGGYKTVSVKVKSASTTNKLTDAKAYDLWKNANSVYGMWYNAASSNKYVNKSVQYKINSRYYLRVDHGTITSVAKLKSYLGNYFDNDVCEFLARNYIDYNGKLYVIAASGVGGVFDVPVSLSVKSQDSDSAVLSLKRYNERTNTYNYQTFYMIYKSGKWVFTEPFAWNP